MATPTESQILTNYLLLPADLRSVITPDKFAALFPAPSRPPLTSSRDQARVPPAQRGGQGSEEGEEGNGEIDDEIEIERALFGASTDAVNSRHTLSSIVPELNAAVADLESQIKALEDEERATIASLQKRSGP
ncbi:unnamed protein product [Parascedosporium putredinis]|uniref:Uncharacterized protein n=1 Tax=Parascedosporium putredinis TaxID=1442378 RepID=A0A9P1H5M4_9PEZI|nr:unnamed protein product [Parascedosporium putredinis]CAI7999475.1 unnamed protein product [Parascedosporium putredinis]